ncbi:NADH:flavin oxidoreductase/NADH oxidase [bacterium]|nr:NADH:flavin oxidoreductase/NADH oxidase [bacterium]
MSKLFDALTLRGVTFRNRIGMSPMCQYSAPGGFPTAWHMQHLGSRAAGGCGLVMTEATAVEPRGRISHSDTGIWNATLASAWRPITDFIRTQGARAGIQLAHAGRKAGTSPPWEGGAPYSEEDVEAEAKERGIKADDHHRASDELHPVGASPIPFDEGWRIPRPLWRGDLDRMVFTWVDSARHALAAGFEVIELHMAHGYLAHSFLSPISNQRPDEYGGSLENRMRFPLMLARGVRAVWPEHLPLFVRISCTDWAAPDHEPAGWDIDEACEFCARLKEIGVDLVDCSSGGTLPGAQLSPVASSAFREPGYQVAFARRIREETGMPTAAVGLITEPAQAQKILDEGSADMVMLGRQLLREPYWPQRAAQELGAEAAWPRQYGRSK